MKQIIILLIALLFVTGCVKTTDLEKRKAQEAAQIEQDIQDLENQKQADANDAISNEEPVIAVENAPVTTEVPTEETETTTIDPTDLTSQLAESKTKIAELEAKLSQIPVNQPLTLGPVLGNPLIVEASNVMLALSINDMATVSLYVPSMTGLRLTPYQNVDLANDVILSQNDVLNWFSLPTTYLWGSYDGSGDPINLTSTAYFTEFIYDYNYLIAPQISQNMFLSSGNLINNVAAVYPTASFVEFYFPGFDPQYGGMDWSSLTLVMENQGGYWKLVGIVHGQWTI